MKKLFFTAVAVLAFSGAGFAEEKVVIKTKKVESATPGCRAAGNAASAYVLSTGGTIDAAMSHALKVIMACNRAANGVPTNVGN